MTKQVLEKLPVNVFMAIENLRSNYHDDEMNKSENRARIAGYVKGLSDAGLITEQERKTLFIYGTI